MISLKQLKSRQPPEFVEDEFSWSQRNEIVMRQTRTLWGKYWVFVGKHRWPARVVLVLATITAIYLAAVFGYLIGVGWTYRIGSS